MLGRAVLRGFSVIELLVAITVLALLIAAAGPSTASWVRSAHTQNVAEAAQNGLRRARAEAMRRQRPVTFWLVTPAGTGAVPPDDTCVLSATSASWVISLEDPSGKCATPSSAGAPDVVDSAGVPLPQNLKLSASASDGTPAVSVTFDGAGRQAGSTSQIARIDITHPDSGVRALRVEVSASGSIRLCDRALPAGGEPKACTE